MSSAVVSTSAALGRPFLFDAEPVPDVSESSGKKPFGECLIAQDLQSTIKNQQSTILHLGNRQSAIENAILPASRLEVRPAPEMATSGIPALDALTGGLPRGCLTEICGPASSGRTSVMLAALAAATRRGEYCALIDASDTLDPHSLAAAGVDLDHLLWVRCNENSPQRGRDTEKTKNQKEGCAISEQAAFNFDRTKSRASEHRLEQVLRATDLLLESGGFGLTILDLADLPYQSARRIPLTTWFRFRRAVEHKPTILLAIEQQPIAGSCSSLLLQLGSQKISGEILHSQSSNSSREAAVWESPARHCRVDAKKENKSRRDITLSCDSNPTGSTTPLISPSHAQLFTELDIHAELIRSRLDRKLARSIAFEAKTAWAG
jgi:hypothetical protein